MLTCGSPQLIAAYRVLLRQSVPWHPPCALIRLILPNFCQTLLRLLRGPTKAFLSIVVVFYSFLCSFQGAIEVSTDFVCLSAHFSVMRNFKTIQKLFSKHNQTSSPTFAGCLPVFLRLCFLLEAFLSSDHFRDRTDLGSRIVCSTIRFSLERR